MLVFHCLGEPVSCFAVVSRYPSKLCSLAITNTFPLVRMVQKKSAFQNLPLEMYLGTMKTITLFISFDLLRTFEGDKGSSEGCVIWIPAFNCLYTWKELISFIF